MGFSLNQISPIMFDTENPQTPENWGTQGRGLTSTPRDRRPPQNTPQDNNPQDQIPDDPAHTNKNCHVPQVGSSYNPDESAVNDHAFQPIQGRFVAPHMTNAPTQQQQQQSSSDEGSGNTTIPQWTRRSSQYRCTGPSNRHSKQHATRSSSTCTASTIMDQRTTPHSPSQSPRSCNQRGMPYTSSPTTESKYRSESSGSTRSQWNHQWIQQHTKGSWKGS